VYGKITGGMMNLMSKIKSISFSANLLLGLVICFSADYVIANPTGAQVVNGQVSFSQPNTNTLLINNSHGSIINWQNFSINAGELTHFQQSGAASAVLNQVTGSNVSNILGSLTSNGQVYLINPYGIVFGENAIVNTAGFIASTLNLSNDDFLQGKLNFSGLNSADILNRGFITAGADGDIALIAPNIINEGVIKVEQGNVILAAGEKVTLTNLQSADIGFEVQADSNTITNLGSVETQGGAVAMFASTLTHSGSVTANALSLDKDGNVVLIAKNDLNLTVSSTVTANGEQGGRVLVQSTQGTTVVAGEISATGKSGSGGVVDVLGQQVAVIDHAVLDVSGTTSGGQVHIGGNYQGQGELENATATYVGKDVSVKADAIESGDGGKIIVWADELAKVYGRLSATGGSVSGNGGFIETSGKQLLDVAGIDINLQAINGRNGEWLLDPFDLTIDITTDTGVTAGPFFSSTALGSVLNVDTLLAQLDAGTAVTINTGSGGVAGFGDITVATAINVTGTNPVSLTLDAANDVIVNAAITSANSPLALTINSDSNYDGLSEGLGNIQFYAGINTNGGVVNLNAGDGIIFGSGGDITTAGGNLSATTQSGDISINSALQVAAGNATITAVNGNVSFASTGSVNAVSGVVNLVASGSVSDVGSPNAIGGSGSVDQLFVKAGAGGISLTSAANDANTVSLTSLGGDITYVDVNGFAMGEIFATTDGLATGAASGDVFLTASDALTDANGTGLNIAAINATISAANGIGSLDAIETKLSGSLNFTNNTEGSVWFEETSINSIDVWGSNNSANTSTFDFTKIHAQFGSLIVPVSLALSSPNSDIKVSAVAPSGSITIDGAVSTTATSSEITIESSLINIAGTLTATGTALQYSLGLIADELIITTGSVNAGVGDLAIETFTDGVDIYMASAIDNIGAMDISQTEVSSMSAGRIGFGAQDFPAAGLGTDVIYFEGAINTGATDTRFASMGGIEFNQGAATAITSSATNGVEINTQGNIVDLSTGVDVASTNGLALFAANGIGDLNPLETQVAGLQVANASTGNININNDVGNLSVAFINQNAATAAVNINNTGGISLVDNGVDVPGITSQNGAVNLSAAAGTIVDAGIGVSSIINADSVTLNSSAGVGSVTRSITVEGLGGGGLTASASVSGDIFIDNLSTGSLDFILSGLTVNGGTALINNLDTTADTRLTGVVSGSGDVSIVSLASMQIDGSFNMSAAGGIDLQSTGTGGSIFINSGSVSSANGAISLSANTAGAAIVSNNGAIQSTGNSVSLLSNGTAGSVVLNNSAVQAANGDINVQANGVSGSVALTSSILQTTGGNISLQSSTSGGSVAITDSTVSSNNANITMQSDTDILLNGVSNIQTALPGVITLTVANGQVLADTTSTITGGGDLNAAANTGISLTGNNNVGTLSLNSTTGDILFADSNDISLGVISAAIASAGVTISSAGSILDANGAANNISGQTVTLNAVTGIGTIADPIETNAQVVLQFSNTSNNDVAITNSATNGVLLNGVNNAVAGDVDISFDNIMQLQDVTAQGNVSLSSVNGAIEDSNDAGAIVVNLTAASVDLSAATGVGSANAIETSLTDAFSGSISVTNSTTGDIKVDNQAVNTTDRATFSASNLVTAGGVYFNNTNAITQASNISTNQGALELKAQAINVTGAINNNDTAGSLSVVLTANDIGFSGGTLNANNGTLDILTLDNGRGITLGGIDVTGTTMDLVQLDVTSINAVQVNLGVMDVVTPFGSGDVNIAGALDFGTKNLTLKTLGNIAFTNGTADGLSGTGNMVLSSNAAITGDNSSGINITAAQIYMDALNGIGSTNAIRTQTADLSVLNKVSNDINITNTGALSLSDSANLAGAMFISSDNSLTLTPFTALASTTGAIASSDLTLKANDLLINGVVSAVNVNLISDNGITVNETVTATTGTMLLNADADANGVGDLLIENVNGGTLNVFSAGNMTVNAASVQLQATNGPVYVRSRGGLDLDAAGNLGITGGSAADADAYLSIEGDSNFNVAGNVLLVGGSASNTAASIFDVSNFYNNILTMNVGGNMTLAGGSGISSGAYVTAGEVNLSVAGDMTLLGSLADNSPAHIRGFALNMQSVIGGDLVFTDGSGLNSSAAIISNDGLGYLQVSYVNCTGCANGLIYLRQPIPNAATNEITNTLNTAVITTDSAISSSLALAEVLDESGSTTTDSTTSSDAQTAESTATDALQNSSTEETSTQSSVLVCR